MCAFGGSAREREGVEEISPIHTLTQDPSLLPARGRSFQRHRKQFPVSQQKQSLRRRGPCIVGQIFAPFDLVSTADLSDQLMPMAPPRIGAKQQQVRAPIPKRFFPFHGTPFRRLRAGCSHLPRALLLRLCPSEASILLSVKRF